MKLSIITINYNNSEGLARTLDSVASQTYRDIEHIIVDGGSTDGSVDIIREYESANSLNSNSLNIKWTSEKDNGIYNAMNKGIEIVLGKRVVNALNRSEQREDKNKELSDYIQILNSGDVLAAPDVIERIMMEIDKAKYPELLYGNCIDVDSKGKMYSQGAGIKCSLLHFYNSTYPHETSFFRRDLFETYGMLDEHKKIVSDWKWFLKAIGLGKVRPAYVDIDVALFDMNGISSTHKQLDAQERRQVLEEELPPAILNDLDEFAFPISQYKRLKKHHLWGLVYFIERVLFKLEVWGILRF